MCIVAVDYRVRGFTRDVKGKKYFIDHKINAIQNYVPEDTRLAYRMADVNLCQENLFHAKILLKGFKLETICSATQPATFRRAVQPGGGAAASECWESSARATCRILRSFRRHCHKRAPRPPF
jgi:hypothetical protein